MTNLKRIFALFFCILMLIPVASAAVVPPAAAPCNVYKSCNHPDELFDFAYYQTADQFPLWCQGSYITFRVLQCQVCGGTMYDSADSDEHLISHDFSLSNGAVCSICGFNKANGTYPTT